MSISPGRKPKHWDGASNPDNSSRGDTEDKVKKKKRKMINLDVMYMGSSDMEGTPKRKKCKVNSENQDIESDPMIPKRKKSGDGYIENPTDQETYTKKKRKAESYQDDSVSSIVLHQKYNKNKNVHKAKDSKRLNEETPCRENTDLEGRSKERKKKKTKKDHEERILDNSLVEDLSSVHTHHTKKKKGKRKDGGDLQGDGLTEEVDESVDQSETAVKKKKKRKEESHQETDDIAANDVSSSVVLYLEENEKIQKSRKAKDPKRLHGDEHFIEETTYSKLTDPEGRSQKKKKKKPEKDCGEQRLEPHQETDDITADNGTPSIVLHDEKNEKIKKSHKAKDTKRLHGYKCFVKETPYSKLTDKEGRLEKKRKPTKDHREKHLDNSLVEELSTVDIKHTKRKNKKWKGGGDLQEDGFTEKLFSQRKSPDSKETSEEVDDSVDQSETAVKKKKKKRKEKSHQETDDIAENDGAIASIVLNGEQNEKIKKSHKSKGHKGRHRDEGLSEKALYREPVDIKDKQSLKNKKDHLIENSSVEEVLISETQHAKKKKSQKDGGGLQDDGFTEELSSHRKSPDGSDAPEQVDGCLDQVDKPKKKKKKRKDESHQEADGIAVDEPSYSELNDTEDRPGQTKEKRSKKVHLECPIEDSILEELLNHYPHDGFTETTEQVVKTVDQAEVHVKKKKAKTKKHLDRSEETSGILAEETLQSRVVESNGNVKGDSENTDQTSTSGPSQPQTCASTDTNQDSNTRDNGSTTSGKNTKESVQRKRIVKMPFGREQDIALIKEYSPTVKEGSLKMLISLNQDLERVRNAKQKGIMFRSGQFTKEEDELIKKNVEKFMSQVGINSPVMLFHPYYFPEQSKTICLLKRKYRFSQRIAEGLYRFCDSVLVRGGKLFHYGENSGRFTEEEKRQLQKYQKLHGDDYVTISKLMSRSVSSSKNKISEMSQEVNTGPWSIEETNLLITAVKEFVLDALRKENPNNEEPVTIPKRKLYKHIKWEQVYKKVGTRNWTHCKTQWSNIIMTRMNDGLHPLKGNLQKLTSMKMIQWLHDAKVKEYGDVKWDKLCDDIGNVTPFYAQLNLIRLKEGINGWKKMRLYEIVDHLYNVTLPKLELLVSDAEIPEPEKKEEFLFSEMFREYTEYDEM